MSLTRPHFALLTLAAGNRGRVYRSGMTGTDRVAADYLTRSGMFTSYGDDELRLTDRGRQVANTWRQSQQTIDIPWEDGGSKRLNRDQLATAYLHFLMALDRCGDVHQAALACRRRLLDDETIPSHLTLTLALAAKACHELDIEP